MQYGAVARCVVYCIDDFGVCGMDDFGVRASLCVLLGVLLCIVWGCIEVGGAGGGPATRPLHGRVVGELILYDSTRIAEES